MENVMEARARQKRLREQYIKPMRRQIWNWLWNTGKRLSSSAHRRRWTDDSMYD